MSKTAILVDGGFYRRRIKTLYGDHPAQESADALTNYCHRHLKEHDFQHDLYRIFYYDCPPVDKQIFHPLTGESVNLKAQDTFDIATLSYNRLVDQIVLIGNDRDFVPAVKLARTAGIDVVLDSLSEVLSPENPLAEHIDGLRSCGNPFIKSRE